MRSVRRTARDAPVNWRKLVWHASRFTKRGSDTLAVLQDALDVHFHERFNQMKKSADLQREVSDYGEDILVIFTIDNDKRFYHLNSATWINKSFGPHMRADESRVVVYSTIYKNKVHEYMMPQNMKAALIFGFKEGSVGEEANSRLGTITQKSINELLKYGYLRRGSSYTRKERKESFMKAFLKGWHKLTTKGKKAAKMFIDSNWLVRR